MVQRRAAGAAISALLAVTALSACGSSDSASDSPSNGSNGADAQLLGPDNKAAGASVKIGFAYDGISAGIDNTAQLTAAQAVVKYANEKLGGVGGRPIELIVCSTKADPSTDCGNQFVKDRVVAVLGASLGVSDPVISAINKAKIPFIDSANQTTQLLTSGINFTLTNPLNSVAGPATLAKKSGIKRVTFVVIDIGPAVAGIKQIAPPLFTNAGIGVDIVAVPPGTADMTPQIQAAQAKNPGMYSIFGNPQFCASALKAIKTLGLKAKVTGFHSCLDKTIAASIPGGFAGMTVFAPVSLDPANSETKLYEAFRETYLKDTPTDSNVTSSYQSVLGFVRAVNAGKLADFTPAGVVAAMKAMPSSELPLGGGTKYKCDGKAFSYTPAICSTAGVLADATADGGQENYSTFDDPTLYAPAAKR